MSTGRFFFIAGGAVAALFVLILIIGMLVASSERKINAALAPFAGHLASEDLAGAQRDVQAAEAVDKDNSRVQDARRKLAHAVAQVKRYNDGRAALQVHQPESAVVFLEPIAGYRDVNTLLVIARYGAGKTAIAAKHWEDARRFLSPLPPSLKDVASLRAQAESGTKIERAVRLVRRRPGGGLSCSKT